MLWKFLIFAHPMLWYNLFSATLGRISLLLKCSGCKFDPPLHVPSSGISSTIRTNAVRHNYIVVLGQIGEGVVPLWKSSILEKWAVLTTFSCSMTSTILSEHLRRSSEHGNVVRTAHFSRLNFSKRSLSLTNLFEHNSSWTSVKVWLQIIELFFLPFCCFEIQLG